MWNNNVIEIVQEAKYSCLFYGFRRSCQSQHGQTITYPVKCRMKLFIHSKTSNNFTPRFTMDVITYPYDYI